MATSAAANAAGAPIDANLYTTYQVSPNGKAISWLTCGATTGSEGCYSSGTLTNFDRVCAIIEGKPVFELNTVKRYLYVLDGRSRDIENLVMGVFLKTDFISSSYDSVTFSRRTNIALPLMGGRQAICSMAANAGFLFADTNTNYVAVEISKRDLSVTTIGGFSPPTPASTITADDRGYVSVTFKGAAGDGFYLYAPDGSGAGDGGGLAYLLNSSNAYIPGR